MAKDKRSQKIRIFFKDGKQDVIPQKLYDDYEYHDGFFLVSKHGRTIAGYNMAIVDRITVGNLERRFKPHKIRRGMNLFLKGGQNIYIPKKKITSYDLFDGMLVLIDGEQWVGMYDSANVDCFATS